MYCGITESTYQDLRKTYELYKIQRLSIDMRRGRPDKDQLSLSDEMMNTLPSTLVPIKGIDIRNYGGLIEGLPSARALFAELMEVESSQVCIGSSSSLNFM